MINRVILVGNLTRDAESISTSGRPMTRLRLATNSTWRDGDGNRQERTEYHTLVTFGRLAEVCALYCTRGRRVYVEGHLRTREYTGNDGMRRLSTEIVAETVKLLAPRPAEDDGGAAAVDEPAEEGSVVSLPAAG